MTSGSTGFPKVVINTHRMLCANQQQISQVWPFLLRHPLVLVDWLPWSHTFGGNHNFNMVLSHGGTMYVDEGRPAPGLIERSLRNLRDVQPNFYFNVPRGFDMLLPFLEQDEEAARQVFQNMEGVFYAAAALPQSLWAAARGGGGQGARAAAVVHLGLGRHRDLARRHDGALAHRKGRLPGAAAAGRRTQAGAQRQQARDAGEGSQHLPRLPATRPR